MITMKEIREQLENIIKEIDDNEKRTTTVYHDHTDMCTHSSSTTSQEMYGTETTERITYGYNGKTGKPEK